MCSCKILEAKRCASCPPPHASSCHVTRGECQPPLTTTRARVAYHQCCPELVSSRAPQHACCALVQVLPLGDGAVSASPPRCCGLLLACWQRAFVASIRLRGCRRRRCALSSAHGRSCASRPRKPAQQAAWWPSHSPVGHSPAQHTPRVHPAGAARLGRAVGPHRMRAPAPYS